MFIPNQKFSDETTLMETLFDFSLGTPSALIEQMIADINDDLKENTAYQEYYESLQEEDDRTELYVEERDMRLAEKTDGNVYLICRKKCQIIWGKRQ